MSDINKGVSNTKIISFADDTRVYNNINTVDDCNVLQSDSESVYNWADINNMLFNAGKFDYLSFACKNNSLSSNVYVNRIRIRIRIILFWIYKYGTISVTKIYNNKNDSRINPGNRYKDIRRGTSVTIRLPGQRKLNKIDI